MYRLPRVHASICWGDRGPEEVGARTGVYLRERALERADIPLCSDNFCFVALLLFTIVVDPSMQIPGNYCTLVCSCQLSCWRGTI